MDAVNDTFSDEYNSEQKPLKRKRLTVAVDPEHTGIRLTGCASFFGIAILGSLLAGTLFNSFLLGGIIGVAAAAAISNLLDRYLKSNWPSGRVLVVNENQIELRKKDEVERYIDPTKQVNVLTWHFKVPRTGRVKKGWHVISLALEQDNTYLPIYTFMSPKDFEDFSLHRYFSKLERPKKEKTEALKNMRRAGEQRRIYEAEIERGLFGAEMDLEHFHHYVAALQENFPRWMITS